MKKLAAVFVLALATLALAACGSSSSSSSTTTSGGQTTEAAGGGGNGGAGGGGGSVVSIETVSSTELAYATEQVSAKAGPVTIEFTNPQELSHDVVVEDAQGKTVGKTALLSNGSTTAKLGDLKPGTYTFYCSVPGHREAGMEGTLTVE